MPGRREAARPDAVPTPAVTDAPEPKKPANLRTALVLLSIAAAFFAGIVVKKVFFG